MKKLILAHVMNRVPVSSCGSENGVKCSKLTVIVEFGNPNSLLPYVGHASMGINDHFIDYGPNVGTKPNLKFVDGGGNYYNSTGYKKKHPKTSKVNTESVSDVLRNIDKFSTGFVVAAHICICQTRAAQIEKRMRELSDGGVYSIPGRQCASTVYAAVFDTSPWFKAFLSPQGLMLKYISRLKHECGPNKGKLAYLDFIKYRLTPEKENKENEIK